MLKKFVTTEEIPTGLLDLPPGCDLGLGDDVYMFAWCPIVESADFVRVEVGYACLRRDVEPPESFELKLSDGRVLEITSWEPAHFSAFICMEEKPDIADCDSDPDPVAMYGGDLHRDQAVLSVVTQGIDLEDLPPLGEVGATEVNTGGRCPPGQCECFGFSCDELFGDRHARVCQQCGNKAVEDKPCACGACSCSNPEPHVEGGIHCRKGLE